MNFDFEVRQLIAEAAGVSVDSLYSDTKLETVFDDDSHFFFWRAIERKYGWMVSHAQQLKLDTVGKIVDELKARARLQTLTRKRGA